MFDVNDNFLPAISPEGENGEPYEGSIRIDCKAGEFLKVEEGSIGAIAIEGKFPADMAYTSLEGAGLDLSAYDGTRQTVLIRFTPDASASVQVFDFSLITV